jgi:O-antigen ligase
VWIAAGVLVILEVQIITGVYTPSKPGGTLERDEASVNGRADIWHSALEIIHDFPLGIGMSMFRDNHIRERYPAPGYDKPILPHAHNEFLQVGTDLGLPGLAVFTGWYLTAAYMLLVGWRSHNAPIRLAAVAVGIGLLAHIAFGMGDAITLWDRLAFGFWWLMGLAGAQYVLARRATQSND